MSKSSSKTLIDLLYECKESPGPRIYKNRSITSTLYRSLTEFQRSLLIKLLSCPHVELGTLVASDIESQAKFKKSEDMLIKKLGIVEKFHKEINGPLYYQLHPVFKESLVFFFCQGLEQIFEIN
jgi:hypothetical protein